MRFQCSSASRKFLNGAPTPGATKQNRVSVLFSEPKIPQSRYRMGRATSARSFSALQRAENSSIVGSPVWRVAEGLVSVLFSEPKIPQCVALLTLACRCRGFSALQRAENSSIGRRMLTINIIPTCFSALQRAENSSMLHEYLSARDVFSFQCSSASRKFLNGVMAFQPVPDVAVSVLFSEPKIPQWTHLRPLAAPRPTFQCSSASRKFLNVDD